MKSLLVLRRHAMKQGHGRHQDPEEGSAHGWSTRPVARSGSVRPTAEPFRQQHRVRVVVQEVRCQVQAVMALQVAA